jgi:hypothetical protein
MKQITEWYKPRKKVSTINGTMRYDDWLLAEAERLTKRRKDLKTEIRETILSRKKDKEPKKYIALFAGEEE